MYLYVTKKYNKELPSQHRLAKKHRCFDVSFNGLKDIVAVQVSALLDVQAGFLEMHWDHVFHGISNTGIYGVPDFQKLKNLVLHKSQCFNLM